MKNNNLDENELLSLTTKPNHHLTKTQNTNKESIKPDKQNLLHHSIFKAVLLDCIPTNPEIEIVYENSLEEQNYDSSNNKVIMRNLKKLKNEH